MAKLISGLGEIRGTIGGLSFYKMKGVEGTVVREKGGFTKERIKTDPKLYRLRLAQVEFGGRSAMSQLLMIALNPQKRLADYNIAGPINKLLRSVQKLDTVNDLGQRGIPLSLYRHVLKGFSLSRNNHFDTVVNQLHAYSLDRETMEGRIHLPALIPGINLQIPAPIKYPYYRFCLSIGMVYTPNGYFPTHKDYLHGHVIPKTIYSEWYPRLQGSPELELSIAPEMMPPDTFFTLVLGIGIQYGELEGLNSIMPARYGGSAKILEVG
jgi:hypothetical protein